MPLTKLSTKLICLFQLMCFCNQK